MLFYNIKLFLVFKILVCDTKKLSNKVYQFDGFSFYSSLEPANYWSVHGHEETQITLPQSRAQAWIKYQSLEGKQYSKKIEPGNAFIVSPNQSHQLDWRNSANLTLFYLHPRFFSNAIDDSIEENNLEIYSCKTTNKLDNTNSRYGSALVDDLLIKEVGVIFRYLCTSGSIIEKLYAENLANLLAVHLLKNYLNYELKIPSLVRGLSQKKLNRVLEYIETNLDRKITLSDLAGITGVGKFYFCRLFKYSLNLSPYQYVLQQRIKRAKKLLKYSDLPICDIALECGFSSQSHLTKHFRTQVRISPMSYRKTS